jgi:hypothetical protein
MTVDIKEDGRFPVIPGGNRPGRGVRPGHWLRPVRLLPMDRGLKESYLSAIPRKTFPRVLDELELRLALALIHISGLFIGADSRLTPSAAFFHTAGRSPKIFFLDKWKTRA